MENLFRSMPAAALRDCYTADLQRRNAGGCPAALEPVLDRYRGQYGAQAEEHMERDLYREIARRWYDML